MHRFKGRQDGLRRLCQVRGPGHHRHRAGRPGRGGPRAKLVTVSGAVGPADRIATGRQPPPATRPSRYARPRDGTAGNQMRMQAFSSKGATSSRHAKIGVSDRDGFQGRHVVRSIAAMILANHRLRRAVRRRGSRWPCPLRSQSARGGNGRCEGTACWTSPRNLAARPRVHGMASRCTASPDAAGFGRRPRSKPPMPTRVCLPRRLQALPLRDGRLWQPSYSPRRPNILVSPPLQGRRDGPGRRRRARGRRPRGASQAATNRRVR